MCSSFRSLLPALRGVAARCPPSQICTSLRTYATEAVPGYDHKPSHYGQPLFQSHPHLRELKPSGSLPISLSKPRQLGPMNSHLGFRLKSMSAVGKNLWTAYLAIVWWFWLLHLLNTWAEVCERSTLLLQHFKTRFKIYCRTSPSLCWLLAWHHGFKLQIPPRIRLLVSHWLWRTRFCCCPR